MATNINDLNAGAAVHKFCMNGNNEKRYRLNRGSAIIFMFSLDSYREIFLENRSYLKNIYFLFKQSTDKPIEFSLYNYENGSAVIDFDHFNDIEKIYEENMITCTLSAEETAKYFKPDSIYNFEVRVELDDTLIADEEKYLLTKIWELPQVVVKNTISGEIYSAEDPDNFSSNIKIDDGRILKWNKKKVRAEGGPFAEELVLQRHLSSDPAENKVATYGIDGVLRSADLLLNLEASYDGKEAINLNTLNNIVDSLSVEDQRVSGQYVSAVSEERGKILINKTAFDTEVLEESTDDSAPTTKAVFDLVKNTVNSLAVMSEEEDGKYIKNLTETNGKIELVKEAFDTDLLSLSNDSGNATAPTSAAVKDFVNASIEMESNRSQEAEEALAELISNEQTNRLATDSQLTEQIQANTVLIQTETTLRAEQDEQYLDRAKEYTNDKIDNLAVLEVGSAGNYIQTISEEAGKISATTQAFDTSISSVSTDNNTPSSKAVKNYVDSISSAINDNLAVEVDARISAALALDEKITTLSNIVDGKSDDNHRHNNATQSDDGFMSSADKKALDTIKDLLGDESGDGDATVNKIREVLDVFENYPEGDKVVEVLSNKSNNDHNHDTVYSKLSHDHNLDYTPISHSTNKLNPHVVTKSQVGLGNADNTSDVNKPISIATQNALNEEAAARNNADSALGDRIDHEIQRATEAESNLSVALANKSDITHDHNNQYTPLSHNSRTDNPHSVTKAQVGLSNVDNTSDANKPISTATQNALNNKVDKVTGKQLSTNDFTNSYKNNVDQLLADVIDIRSKLATVTITW